MFFDKGNVCCRLGKKCLLILFNSFINKLISTVIFSRLHNSTRKRTFADEKL